MPTNRAAEAYAELLDQLAHAPRPAPCIEYPDAWLGDDAQTRYDAARVCRSSCPVLDTCRSYADQAGERWGVWGGRDRSPTAERWRARAHPPAPPAHPTDQQTVTARTPKPTDVDCPECRQPAGNQCHWPGYGSQDFPHASRVFIADARATEHAEHRAAEVADETPVDP